MTPVEAAQILAAAAAYDPRLNTADADQARARVIAWSDVLADVPFEWVGEHVRRVYKTERKYSLQPGEVRDAWLLEQRRSRRGLPEPGGVPPPDELGTALDKLRAANRAAGRAPLARSRFSG